jgi:hypothetical protein
MMPTHYYIYRHFTGNNFRIKWCIFEKIYRADYQEIFNYRSAIEFIFKIFFKNVTFAQKTSFSFYVK